MPREPSAIMSISDKKVQIKDLKTQIKVIKDAIKNNERFMKTDKKTLAKLEAQLAVLSPKKVKDVLPPTNEGKSLPEVFDGS